MPNRSIPISIERVVFVVVEFDCGLTDRDAVWLLAQLANRHLRVVSGCPAVRRAAILTDYAGTCAPDEDAEYDGVSILVTKRSTVDTAFDVTYHAPTRTLTARPGVLRRSKRPRSAVD